MKTRSLIAVLFALILCCPFVQAQQSAEVDLLTEKFEKEQDEVKAVLEDIKQALIDGDLDKLISFHAYGPKFTEFKNGEPRNDGAANEAFEREVFGGVTSIDKFNFDDLMIAVYGDVANVTFHSDFHLKFGENAAVVKEQISLLFLKTDKGWKIVHEHHSPLKEE